MHVIEEPGGLEDSWGRPRYPDALGGASANTYPPKPLYAVVQVVYCINLRGVEDHLNVSSIPIEGQCTAWVLYVGLWGHLSPGLST